jgi:DNA-binding XRE family transcriptional regulator/thiol-disulfide isomerase/thioredoxin
MSQQELAGKAGVIRQTIAAFEKGRFTPSTVLALKIASIFNLAFLLLFAFSCESSNNDTSEQLPVVREAYIADCPISGSVANKDYHKVLLFRPEQAWSKEEPLAVFRVKKGRFSGTAKMDTTLVYELFFTVPGSGRAEGRPFVPTQTGIQVVCPDGMTGDILLQSDSEENANLNGYEEISRSLRPVSSPIYQKYNQLSKEGRLYNDEVEALRAEEKTASRERANEIWFQVDKLKNFDESYSEEGLVAKKELDAFNAMRDSLHWAYLEAYPMLSSFYEVWQGIKNARQQGKDFQPWLDLYESHYAKLFPGHPYHAMILGLTGNNVGEKFRDFTLPDAEGVEHRFSDLTDGKMAIVDFWASWCGNCRIRSKSLIPIYEKYAGRDFTIVGVANEFGNDAKWRAALKRDGYPWLNLISVDGSSYIQSNHGRIFLLDRDGTILAIDPTIEEIEAMLK